MYTRRSMTQLAAKATLLPAWLPSFQTNHTLLSPNQRIKVVVRTGADQPDLTVYLDNFILIECSGLAMDRAGLGQPKLTSSVRSQHEETYTLVTGKTGQVVARCNELTLTFNRAHQASQLVVRVYDDGVAFRYRYMPQPGLDGMTFRGESTQFHFARDYLCWGCDLGAFNTSHEGLFKSFRASEIAATSLLDAPLVCMTGQGDVTLALAEADLEHYPAVYFARSDDGHPGVKVKLAPRPDDGDVAIRVEASRPLISPWRVIMIGDHPGRLIESTLITTLSSPSRIADTSWIKPGKAAWDWWSGAALDDVAGPRMSDATMMRLIDFASVTNLQYLLIDAGWYDGPDSKAAWPQVDVTRSVSDINLPRLVAYGRQRGIGLFLWLNWRHLDPQMQAAMTWYQRLGIKGIKVDFMNRDDQQMMDFYHRLLVEAADHRLMVDLHGASHCTGLERTYPNLLTQEGVMGSEYNKWTNQITSRHNVTIPYTRMLLGPMDYAPGGFTNVKPEQFVAREVSPMVQTTRGQALAMYVVYDSPFACVADSPDVYRDQPGVDFISLVPTSWDETRMLSGRIAEFIVLARRKQAHWFIGAMTDAQRRVVPIELSFLGEGKFTATLYSDGEAPALLAIERDKVVERGDIVTLALAENGGSVVVIQPMI